MKNGDPRSSTWTARALKEYTRDDEAVQTALMLVDLQPTPSLDAIKTWTDEQCLLAEDWAWSTHSRASDNINRVPALPEHLKSYRPAYPERTPAKVARAIVEDMSGDNGACFHPTEDQLRRLEAGIERMQKAGAFFTDAAVSLLGSGEHGECLAHFQRFDGFEVALQATIDIFEELGANGRPKDQAEGELDRKRWHARPRRAA